jgi:anaphase-promoting complex subunit 1
MPTVRRIIVRAPRNSENDVALQVELRSRLMLLGRRTLASPVGRGMFSFGSIHPVLTDMLPIPELSLMGRVPPKNTPLSLDPNQLPENLTCWAEFHNGVAAGLRVSQAQSKITRTWIIYNKPDQLNYSHAGFLMALGLLGHLEALAPADFYTYLLEKHEPTSVGVLLGMAVTKRASLDAVSGTVVREDLFFVSLLSVCRRFLVCCACKFPRCFHSLRWKCPLLSKLHPC